MKNYFLFSFIAALTSILGYSQDYTETARVSGHMFINPAKLANRPQGTPYNQFMFASAKVTNATQKYYMRYNAYEDDFEFITPKNDTLIMDKIDDFNTIDFIATKKKYVLINYTNSNGKFTKGYLVDFYDKGNFTLFKKENIIFYEEKIAKTSLERSMPAKYVKADDTYYLKTKEGTIVEFPESKKQLVKLFPDKKEVIEVFVKENKVSFNADSDRIRIIDFLTTL